MTLVASDPMAFHLGYAVRDVDRVMARYTQLFGELHWRVGEAQFPAMPSNPQTTAARLKFAYGRIPGATLELIEVLEGETIHTEFLRNHGEGVHHLGVWVPDVQAAVRTAVEQGGRIVTAMLNGDTASVQLSPASSPSEIIAAVNPSRMAWVDLEDAGGVSMEFVGPATYQGLRQGFGDLFDTLIESPVWAAEYARQG